jgi:ferrous iron transport protein B
MGQGISELFDTAIAVIRQGTCPLPHEPSPHIMRTLGDLRQALNRPDILESLHISHFLLLKLFAAEHPYFEAQLQAHFPDDYGVFQNLRQAAQQQLPRSLADEIHADRHHRAAILCEEALCMGQTHTARDWRSWLDAFMLHPQWGLLSSILVFAGVLWMVFEGSAWIDAHTTQLIVAATQHWQPTDTVGVLGRAVLDGFIGLTGIVLPYMIPLVLLLIALEEAGIMHRIAFVVDRGFHHIGLHGGVAVPFLLGLGCNVPAISAVARNNTGRERLIASVLITFVPCSARSAIILAIAGKYLGIIGVTGLYALMLVLIAVLGQFLSRQRPREVGPGQVQQIPPYALPHWRSMVKETWLRTSDILTIVTPLLVGGSVILALLSHWGADSAINIALTPLTVWWLGLPLALGLPLLFGVLRKELSLLMIFQALGTQELDTVLSTAQIATLLVFLIFYVPCVSTFAVMLKTMGAKQAWGSVGLSVGVALALALVARAAMAVW